MPVSRGEERHRHRLIRRVVCVRGEIAAADGVRAEVRLRAGEPRDDPARARGRLPLEGSVARAVRPVGGRAHRAGLPQHVHAPPRRERDLRPRAVRRRRAARALGGSHAGPLRGHRLLLAGLAREIALRGTLARDGAPLGAHAEAPDVRAERRDRGRADHQPARAARRRAQLGLPLHVDPRRGVLALRAPSPGLHRGGRSVHGLAHRAVPGRAQPRRRAAADHVRHRRALPADRGDARPPVRLPGLVPGPHRQRRGRPAPARHLRRADGLGLPLQQVRHARVLGRLDRPFPHRRVGVRQLGPAPTRASGRFAAAGRTSSTPG